MLIPYTQLSESAFDSLLDDFSTRDGTDNGQFTTLEERNSELLRLLKSEQAFITFNSEYQQACLVSRHEVTNQAIREYRELIRSLENEGDDKSGHVEDDSDEQAIHHLASSASTAEPTELKPLAENGKGTYAEQIAEHLTSLNAPVNPGQTKMTHAVSCMLEEGAVALPELQELLHKHCSGDFGVIPDIDKLANFEAIPLKELLRSRYILAGKDFVVITDHGHERTTVMLSSDY